MNNKYGFHISHILEGLPDCSISGCGAKEKNTQKSNNIRYIDFIWCYNLFKTLITANVRCETGTVLAGTTRRRSVLELKQSNRKYESGGLSAEDKQDMTLTFDCVVPSFHSLEQ